jgi:cytochrome b561
MGLAWAAFHARQCHRVCGPRVAARAWERRRAVDTEWTQGKVVFDPETKSAFDQQFRAVRAIHFAMLLSLAAYLVLGLVFRPALAMASETEASGLLVQFFYAVCAGIALAIFLLRKRLIQPSRTGSATRQEAESWSRKFRTGHIVIYALCEAIGVFGLVALFVAGSQTHFISLILLSFALMFFLRPKRVDSINS